MRSSQGGRKCEFACDAGAVIAAHTYRLEVMVGTGKKSLASRGEEANYPVTSHTKLAAYWASG